MFLTLFGCWCITVSFSVIDSQEIRNSFNNGYDSRFSNFWNSNSGFSTSNNKPLTGNINIAEPNFFSSNGSPKEYKFSSTGSEKNSRWGEEAAMNIDKTSNWNSKEQSKANNVRKSNSFNNQPNEKTLNSVMNLSNSSKWNSNSNSFISNSNKGSNSDFSSWGYNSEIDQINKKFEGWNPNDPNKSKSNKNDIFSKSDNEGNSAYSFWGSNNNKKTKPTLSSYDSYDNRESTFRENKENFENSKWETKTNKKPQKVSEYNVWKNITYSQPGEEKILSNSNPSVLDTSILDEMDKNDWYFGKEQNYPKPPFRSTLNIDVSELWNFDRNKKTKPNSRKNGNFAMINNNNNRRNRQIERPIKRLDSIHCECVNVNLCKEENMIITQEDLKFDLRPLEEFMCERLTEVCCTNPKIKKGSDEENFEKEKERLKCGQTRVKEAQFDSFRDKIANPGEFPWSLRLEHPEINCSASLIHRKMALTAAHCVASVQPEELTLKAAVWNSNSEPHQNRKVTKIIQHPGYDSRNPRNDIALLILESPFELTDNVNTICLPKTNDNWDSNQCVVASWRSEEIHGQYSEVLEKVHVNFLPQIECQGALMVTDLWRNYMLHDSFICATEKTPRKSCTGNEGGFVICPSKKQPRTYLQIGVVSLGINCDNFGRPGIFTNVLKFLDWINQNYFELYLSD